MKLSLLTAATLGTALAAPHHGHGGFGGGFGGGWGHGFGMGAPVDHFHATPHFNPHTGWHTHITPASSWNEPRGAHWPHFKKEKN
jgi:hypothetical protein